MKAEIPPKSRLRENLVLAAEGLLLLWMLGIFLHYFEVRPIFIQVVQFLWGEWT
jgi:hypothetical protein